MSSKTDEMYPRIHRGERPFICDLCGRGFPIQSSLLTHKKQSHPDGSKTWLCDFCEHKFVSKSQLEIHRRVGESFKKRSNLFCV